MQLIYGTKCMWVHKKLLFIIIDVHIPNDHHDNRYSDG